MSKPSPFDFTKAVGERTDDAVVKGELDVNDMNTFMVCRSLAHRMDAIDGVCLVNERQKLSKTGAYAILRATIRKRSPRNGEFWAKGSKAAEGLSTVKDHFGVGDARAAEILDSIGPEGVASIEAMKGGAEKRTRVK